MKKIAKNQSKKFRIENVLKRKGDKLYVKWKGYDNSFNSWIDVTFNVTHVDTSGFALKTNLASLKTEVDKLDIGKLTTVPVDLSKLGDVVKIYVVKKAVYDKLAVKVNNIDTSDVVLKSKYQIDKTKSEKNS